MSEASITLSALNKLIRLKTEESFPIPVWIVAEILEMQVNRTGHCYMELIEKSDKDDSIIAKNRATIWAYKYSMLKPFFETTTGSQLLPGIKILIRAEVTFHEVYGLSLNISDIDPSFTLGEMAMKRREIIKKLEESGVIDMNRDLPFPSLPQSIAVISSETAAGFGDFMDTLANNTYRFITSCKLFPAAMQGESAEKSIIKALEDIYNDPLSFDIVVLIRGGGSQSDLDCFNGYDLAMNIAQFPIPVLTGIGHERDETIADLVAHRSLKTPTAVAEFIIDVLLEFSTYLENLQERFQQKVNLILQQEKVLINQFANNLSHIVQQHLTEQEFAIKEYNSRLISSAERTLSSGRDFYKSSSSKVRFQWKTLILQFRRDLENLKESQKLSVKNRLSGEFERIANREKHLDLMRPEYVLARGYSITYANGKTIKSIKDLKRGDKLLTKISDGSVESIAGEITGNKKSLKT